MSVATHLIPKVLEKVALLKQIYDDRNSYSINEISDAITSFYELIDRIIELTPPEEILPGVELLTPFIEDARKYYIAIQNNMENAIANELITNGARIRDYWQNTYKDSYQIYNAIETQSITQTLGVPKNILVVGSGALPLTAISLKHSLPNTNIKTLDQDHNASDMSKQIITLLENDEKEITVLPSMSVETVTDFQGIDLLVLLASVGLHLEDKYQLLNTISSRLEIGTYILLRHAYPKSLGTLIFSPFEFNKEQLPTYEQVSTYGYNNKEVLTHSILKKI